MPAVVQAAVAALQALVQRVLPVPVVLEHLVRPLLGALGSCPDAAVALVHLAADLGGALAARHVLPLLLELLNGAAGGLADTASVARAAGLSRSMSPVSELCPALLTGSSTHAIAASLREDRR